MKCIFALLITFILTSSSDSTLSFINTAQAQESVFRCRHNGHTTYSQLPCTQGKSESITIKALPANQQAAAKQKKEHQQRSTYLKKVEAEREKEYAKLDKERNREAQRYIRAKKHCDDLRKKTQWAKEDLRNSTQKTEVKARIKLKRAQQTEESACKAL
jgi:hypothetical protein